jgi:hypothetical protein
MRGTMMKPSEIPVVMHYAALSPFLSGFTADWQHASLKNFSLRCAPRFLVFPAFPLDAPDGIAHKSMANEIPDRASDRGVPITAAAPAGGLKPHIFSRDLLTVLRSFTSLPTLHEECLRPHHQLHQPPDPTHPCFPTKITWQNCSPKPEW